MREQVAKQLDELRTVVDTVTSTSLSELEFADALGEVRYFETKLAAYRRAELAEAPEWQTGNNYELVTTRANAYSFNEQAILSALAAEGVTMLDLVNSGAVVLDWKISKLRNIFEAIGADLRFKPSELEPDDLTVDGPMVGKYKKPAYTRVTGLGKKETSISRKKAEDEAYG